MHLLGTGLPSFYVADLGDLSFTLGLSGWTANDWSTAGNFDLMAPRGEVDEFTRRRVFEALKETWSARPEELASKLGLERGAVLGALSAWTQAGRAIWDLNKGVYRARELSREPLPMDKLRFSNEREERATRFLDARAVDVKARPERGWLAGAERHGEGGREGAASHFAARCGPAYGFRRVHVQLLPAEQVVQGAVRAPARAAAPALTGVSHMRKGRVRARGGQGAVPCNPDGVSPSMPHGLSCITGPLLTVRCLPPCGGSAVDLVGPAAPREGAPLELRRVQSREQYEGAL